MARPDFQRAVESIDADDEPEQFHGRLGTYTVELVSRHGRNVYFTVAGGGFLDRTGFAYLPAGPPATPDRLGEAVTVTPFSGPWYRFSYTW